MMKFIPLFALFALFAVAAAGYLPFDSQLDSHWENFKKVYGKKYSGTEERDRRVVWEGHVNANLHHNLAADMGLLSFKQGINAYSDMTHQEFVAKMNGFKMSKNTARINGSTWIPPSNVKYPESVDWRNAGLVTPVKDQADCGSCWAFSSTGSLEGQHKKKTGKLVSLSEQNLIDCSRPEGNEGCDGGVMDDAFRYIQRAHGIDTEESYPYTARDGICHFKASDVGATCTGFVDISKDEDALMKAVATVGPISVAIDASQESFKNYKSGVYDEKKCDPINLDHGVLLVGYGNENGKDFWLVKNSWGESWGLNGYIKMSRNKNNQCGIATMASYPLV